MIGGLYATAIATMGMFASGVYVLSMSGFGPIADNAGGIVEMSDQPESVRDILIDLTQSAMSLRPTPKDIRLAVQVLPASCSSVPISMRSR